MSQEHNVLKCFSCETFQVHIVKKAKKWECKVCGAKQSLKRNYGKGSAKDCRMHVMKLNELRLTKANSSEQTENEIFEDSTNYLEESAKKLKGVVSSKWDQYLENCTNDGTSDVDDDVPGLFVGTEKKKRVGKLNKPRLAKGESFKQTENEFFENSRNYLKEGTTKSKEVVSCKWDQYLENRTNNSKSDIEDEVQDLFVGTEKNKRVGKLKKLSLMKANSSEQIENEIFENSTNYFKESATKPKEIFSSKWDQYLESGTNNSKSDIEDDMLDLLLGTEKKKKRVEKFTKEHYPSPKKVCLDSSKSGIVSEPSKETLVSSTEKKFYNSKDSPIKIQNKLKKSKYAKYIDEEEDKDELIQEDKYLNIFDAQPTDLDNVLNF